MMTKKIQTSSFLSILLLLVAGSFMTMMLSGCEAFAPIVAPLAQQHSQQLLLQQQYQNVVVVRQSVSVFSSSSLFTESASTMDISAGTVDPTTFLSDVLSGIIGTPLILAVPILAAFAVAGLIAYIIISYANPEVEDDEI